jgi:hypothetical protein
MTYTPDQLNFIIGPTEAHHDVAIKKEIATITTHVRCMMTAHTDYLMHGERPSRLVFYAADLVRQFIKKKSYNDLSSYKKKISRECGFPN